MHLKAALRELFRANPETTADDLRALLDDARAEAAITQYQADGLLPADQATIDAAKAIRATHPDALDIILRAQRPVPTATTAAATAALSTDPIQTQADALGIPYHEAAAGGTTP